MTQPEQPRGWAGFEENYRALYGLAQRLAKSYRAVIQTDNLADDSEEQMLIEEARHAGLI